MTGYAAGHMTNYYTVFSPVWIEGILGMYIWGGAMASVHIKVIGSTPIPTQSKTAMKGRGGQYPLLTVHVSMLGRTLVRSMAVVT